VPARADESINEPAHDVPAPPGEPINGRWPDPNALAPCGHPYAGITTDDRRKCAKCLLNEIAIEASASSHADENDQEEAA